MPSKQKHPGMTNAEFKLLGEYIRDMANDVGLHDWHLMLLHEPCRDSKTATVEILYGQRHANIQVCECWMEHRPEDQRASIVHELVHCHVENMATLSRDLRKILGEAMYLVWDAGFNLALEHSTDSIAVFWAKTLPLPPKVKKSAKKRK